jgi:erythrocyte band 7 integral membrane protein
MNNQGLNPLANPQQGGGMMTAQNVNVRPANAGTNPATNYPANANQGQFNANLQGQGNYGGGLGGGYNPQGQNNLNMGPNAMNGGFQSGNQGLMGSGANYGSQLQNGGMGGQAMGQNGQMGMGNQGRGQPQAPPPIDLNQPMSFQLRKEPKLMINEMYDHTGAGVIPETEDNGGTYATCMSACGGCCACCSDFIVPQGYVGIKTEFGKFVELVGSGRPSYNPCTQKISLVNIMVQVLNLPPQKILTKDGLQLNVSAYIRYRVINPELYLFQHKNAHGLLVLFASGVLKAVTGSMTLSENLQNQAATREKVGKRLKNVAQEYGLVVYDLQISNMMMAVNLQRALAVVAESEREYKANIIKARASRDSSKIYRMAADELMKNPIAVQLQYYDLLKEITNNRQSLMLLRDTVVDELKKSAKRGN